MASWVSAPPHPPVFRCRKPSNPSLRFHSRPSNHCWAHIRSSPSRIYYSDDNGKRPSPEPVGIQLYNDIERLIIESAKLSNGDWRSGDWSEIEGTWVLRPRYSKPTSVVHFIGGIFVGAAPQLTYRLFLERLSEKGSLVIATPFASGFDYFYIADEVQCKFDRCLRSLRDLVDGLPTFGVGHSLGSVIHLLIGSRYAVPRSGNVFMAFNNKEASEAVPLFSPVIVPVAQSFGPLLSQLTSSPTIRLGIRSYYGISRNLLVKFKDDLIDETPALAKVLCSESAVSSMLDMSIRMLPGDHGLPLQQALPDIPPAMADAVNRGGELLANLTVGTPWETVAKEVGNTLGADSKIIRAQISKDVDLLVDVIATWMALNSGPKLLRR
ncbi:uncharacterized protein LOC131246460 isoform X4 [Magnolia sinica]|uniref:uncharacterized protein LOC131246460 isoform X4 n=1 Tax=Magnolia sinica TaxID=86752 RepID=UPI0026594E17|nr:uncharacterized protein LOC131246460 isoform X4 [Magnolia sinica]